MGANPSSARGPSFWGQFRRITTSGRTIVPIDGLRFLAISAVILYHVGEITHKYQPDPGAPYPAFWYIGPGRGFYGVQLFFLISGFILALPFARHHLQDAPRPNVRRYYLRRLTRLEPPYLLTLLIYFVLLIRTHKYHFRALFPHLLASVLYLHGTIYHASSWVNPSAWSLEVEVQFYLLAPWLTFVFALPARKRRTFLILSVPFLSGVSLLATHLGLTNTSSLLLFANYFAAGFLLAELYLTGQIGKTGDTGQPAPTYSNWPFLGLLCAFIGLGLARNQVLDAFALPWLFLALGICAFETPGFNRAMTWGPIPIWGGMVYTIYLLHAQIISAVAQLVARHGHLTGLLLRDSVGVGLLSLPITFVFVVIFFRLVEQPCMNPRWPEILRAKITSQEARTAAEAIPTTGDVTAPAVGSGGPMH